MAPASSKRRRRWRRSSVLGLGLALVSGLALAVIVALAIEAARVALIRAGAGQAAQEVGLAAPLAATLGVGLAMILVLRWRGFMRRGDYLTVVLASALVAGLLLELGRFADLAALPHDLGGLLRRPAALLAVFELGDRRLPGLGAVLPGERLWLALGGEVVLAVGVALTLIDRALAVPFCAGCRRFGARWTQLARLGPARADQARRALAQRDWSFFGASVGPAVATSASRARAVRAAPGSRRSGWSSVAARWPRSSSSRPRSAATICGWSRASAATPPRSRRGVRRWPADQRARSAARARPTSVDSRWALSAMRWLPS